MKQNFNHFLSLVDSLKASARPPNTLGRPVKPPPWSKEEREARNEAVRQEVVRLNQHYRDNPDLYRTAELLRWERSQRLKRTEQSDYQADVNDQRNGDWTR